MIPMVGKVGDGIAIDVLLLGLHSINDVWLCWVSTCLRIFTPSRALLREGFVDELVDVTSDCFRTRVFLVDAPEGYRSFKN